MKTAVAQLVAGIALLALAWRIAPRRKQKPDWTLVRIAQKKNPSRRRKTKI